jgi:hypothetical protein
MDRRQGRRISSRSLKVFACSGDPIDEKSLRGVCDSNEVPG